MPLHQHAPHRLAATAAALALFSATTAPAAVTENLQGYWSLDDATGPVTQDGGSVDFGNGTVEGSPTLGVAAVVGEGIDFELDNGDNLNFNGTSTSVTNQYSFAAFVKAESFNADTGANARNALLWTNGNVLGFGTANGKPFHIYSDGSFQTFTAADTLSTGVFHHLAITRNSTSLKFYVDGQLVETQATPATNTQNDEPRIAYGGGGRTWDGVIDDLGLWSRELSAEEIALINGLGRFAGVALNDSAIDDVLAAFHAGTGNSADAGGYTWEYASGLGTDTIGQTGGSVVGGDAYIALDDSGNGVRLIPEPASLGLLWLGGWLLARRR